MKFIEAAEKLRQIANGKYHSIAYELITYQNGEHKSDCRLYIEGSKWFCSPTFDMAFAQLQKTLEEVPDVEA